jgi:uncharacterized protein YaiI (UPF0178 family)
MEIDSVLAVEMKLRTVLVSSSMLACFACSGQLDSPHTVTDSGVVSGVREGDVVVYKGIPFAAPPDPIMPNIHSWTRT